MNGREILADTNILLCLLYALKLADSVIAATATHLNIPLFTADKQISQLQETEVILYKWTNE